MGLSTYAWAQLQNKNNPNKTFLYQFMRKPPATGERKRFGAYHTAEIGYALHNLDSIGRHWESIDYQLEQVMSTYWVQFVKTGNPNQDGKPVWRNFSNEKPYCVLLGDSVVTAILPGKEALDFLYARYPVMNKK